MLREVSVNTTSESLPLEPLERRALLSATLGTAGTLSIGGTGRGDTIVVSIDAHHTDRLIATLNGSSRSFDLRRVRRIVVQGGAGDDRITLDQSRGPITLPTTLFGQAGNDSITGASGRDRIFGGVGNDRIGGGNNRDVIYGESGDDRIAAGSHDDWVDGGAGDDVLKGDGGRDVLHGGDDDDNCDGDDGNDSVCGELGNDVCAGGAGRDVVMGGAGADRFGKDDDEGEDADQDGADVGPDHQHALEHDGNNDHDDADEDGGDNQDQTGEHED
jgi:Ca2+-binding RTX toxin-like protein